MIFTKGEVLFFHFIHLERPLYLCQCKIKATRKARVSGQAYAVAFASRCTAETTQGGTVVFPRAELSARKGVRSAKQPAQPNKGPLALSGRLTPSAASAVRFRKIAAPRAAGSKK